MVQIIIAGDFCPKDRVADLFEKEKYGEVLGEVKPIVEGADYAIVNLESPIVNGEAAPIKKSGPNLKSSNKIVKAIKYAGFKGVTLANNHFYDYGENGVLTTFKELKSNSIDYVGAGINIDDASKILNISINGKNVAFINCCEHEFSIATDISAGCNPLDIIGQYHVIQKAKRSSKYVIVIIHGGIEMFQLPTPRMVKTYRFFIEAGADAVINHHQHCFSGYEYYLGKPIIYGLGNFCFDWKGKTNDIWFQGYMAKLLLKDDNVNFTPIPYIQCDEKPAIQLSIVKKSVFEQRIRELCSIISDEKLLLAEYEKLLQRTWRNYDLISPYANRYMNWLYKKGALPSIMPKKKLYSIINAIRCESQQERLLDTLNKKIKQNKQLLCKKNINRC